MNLPFDVEYLDELMDEDGIDLMLATDRETVQYLTGGYRFFFLAHKDALGVSRYMPTLGYPRGKPENAFYIGHGLEPQHQAVEPIWTPTIRNTQLSSAQGGHEAAEMIRKLGLANRRIGIQMSFLPADAYVALREDLPDADFVDVLPMMQELRAVKRPDELEKLRHASNEIIEVMKDVMTTTPAGTTTADIVERVRREEVNRGLNFEYCLAAAGPCFNRTPSEQFTWNRGEILSLDSGANYDGYLGDLCRMAVIGEPTQLMRDLLSEIRAAQDIPRTIIKAGVTGDEIYASVNAVLAKCDHRDQMVFRAHGMGTIQHEAPHIDGAGVISYPNIYAKRPLRAGMVLSIETDLRNPDVGFVKLEDTVVVTEDGCEGFGDDARDWVVAEG